MTRRARDDEKGSGRRTRYRFADATDASNCDWLVVFSSIAMARAS
jgi:hypothetical protein